MDLAYFIEQQRKEDKNSFLNCTLTNKIPPQTAQKIKEDTFFGFIKNVNYNTLSKEYKR